MNKRDIAKAVVEQDARLTQADVIRVLEALPTVFSNELCKPDGSGKLYFKDIGTFSIAIVPQKQIKVMFGEEKGKYIDICKGYRVKFKPSTYLKDVVKESLQD